MVGYDEAVSDVSGPPSPQANQKRSSPGAGAGLGGALASFTRGIVRVTAKIFGGVRDRGGKSLADFRARPEHSRWRAYTLGCYGLLVAGDDPEIGTFLATLLELEGIESQVATSAAAALERLEGTLPSLVLLDIAMPDRDGLDLCRELKKDPRTRDVPVFVVSARPGKDVVERALAAGAEEFIRKPFENQELIARIRDRLASAHA